MLSVQETRHALEGLGMVEGLSAKDVDDHLGRYQRLDDIGHRGVAFYLLDVHERRLYQHWDYSSTLEYALHRHGISHRRTRERLAAARALRELSLIDAAFCAQKINWTQVLLLVRVAVPEHEAAWLEKAKDLGYAKLAREVLLAKQGAPPRQPGDTKGVPAIRYPIKTTLSRHSHDMLVLAQQKMAQERGRPVPLEELLDVVFGIYIDMERKGESEGWNHVPSSLYRIIVHAPGGEPGADAPLFVDTEDGLLPMDGSGEEDVVARQRGACACCDGEVVADSNGEKPADQPTPPAMRKRVLARDGQRCRCCGSRRELHVHHITWRSNGGPTKVHNLLALCKRCHSLIHEGLLQIGGTTQKKARFLDRNGRDIHGPRGHVDKAKLLEIERPPRRMRIEATPAPTPNHVTLDHVTLDTMPAEVDTIWWRRHADLIRCRGDQGMAFRSGAPADPVHPVEAPSAQESERAFDGLVGQDALIDRFEIEAEGGRLLGESFPHTLFTGSPGTGKTTLAAALAARLGVRLVRTNGPLVKDVATLVRLLASLDEGDMLFLDEIHAVPQGVLEVLYEAMAEGRLSLTFHQGSREKRVELRLPAFTVIAATTQPADLPRPLVTRFALREHLDRYDTDDLAALATARAASKGFEMSPDAAERLAGIAYGIPREVLRLADRAVRYVARIDANVIDRARADEVLESLGYDERGLGPIEQRCLALLRGSRDAIPAARLARFLGIDTGTLLGEIEPRLLQSGLIRITPRGRRPAPWARGAAGRPNPHYQAFAGRRSLAISGAEDATSR